MEITNNCQLLFKKKQGKFLFAVIQTAHSAQEKDSINLGKLLCLNNFEILFLSQYPSANEFEGPAWNNETIFLGTPKGGKRVIAIICKANTGRGC